MSGVTKRKFQNKGVCLRCEREYGCEYDYEHPDRECYCGACRMILWGRKKKDGK